ncbi:hypothetical protein JNUCC76_05940 [Leuconostoc sp. JNUCC 76]
MKTLSQFSQRRRATQSKIKEITKNITKLGKKYLTTLLCESSHNDCTTNIETTDGYLIPNVTGLVNGFTELGVYINQQFIAFEDIRTVIREK